MLYHLTGQNNFDVVENLLSIYNYIIFLLKHNIEFVVH